MSPPVDVLAVMLRAEAGREWDMNKAAAGGDMSAASSAEEECRQMRAARAAVADLLLEGARLMKGLDSVNGMTVVQPHDVANFKIALARATGAGP